MEINKKSVMMVLPHMVGGGAERVAAMLLNEFHNNGYDATFLLTSARREEVINRDLKSEIPLILLQEQCGKKKNKAKQVVASLLSHVFENTGHSVPAQIAYFSFMVQYQNEIEAVRRMLMEKTDMTIVAFSQPAIPIVLLAARGLPNRIVISERTDPNILMKKRYGRKFIEKYYSRVDVAVFQTKEALMTYPTCVSHKGIVISNPVKDDLPEPYFGKREKNITTFCRISPEKDLHYLVSAFMQIHEEHPDYHLRIIGGAVQNHEKKVLEMLTSQITEFGLENAVSIEPFSINVHEKVLRDLMYINCSEREGLSNAMLEAMVIGMPVICTDCPIGGARATITDGENGLLVPVKDTKALYKAMKRIIEEPGLAEKLSVNAAKLRDYLSLNEIATKWMELL